jgi:hypothetical protein
MVMAHFTTNKVVSTQATGITTRWTVMGLCITLMVEWLMKDSGKMTRFMEKVSCTMKILSKFRGSTISGRFKLAIKSSVGCRMMVGLRMMINADSESYC